MKWSKYISAIFYPLVMPTLGVIIYLMLLPPLISYKKQLVVIGTVFVATYLIPFLLIFLLKQRGHLETFDAKKIKERKVPVLFIITLYFVLGMFFSRIPLLNDITCLFYGTVFSLLLVYLLFFIQIKASLHMLAMGGFIGFFLEFQRSYNVFVLPLIAIFFIFSGFVGTSRLDLKAHTSKEVYIGFFIGIIGQLAMCWAL